MTKTIQHLRGTTAQNAAFTGASGEITVDIDTHELRVHDGSTAGGHIIYTKSDVDTALSGKADAATTYTKTEVNNIASGKANVALDNLSSVGQNISNWSHNVTNCITEIPQDIKLELSSGTLTLKAGSKVYVPNGVDTFDEVPITADKTNSFSWMGSGTKYLLTYKTNDNSVDAAALAYCSSGTSFPAGAGGGWICYRTDENKIYRHNGSNWENILGLPLGIVTGSGSGVASIDQVFNGFGYIGSTVFALPGVKGLIPNGFNADGTLKNIVWTNSSVLIHIESAGSFDSRPLWVGQGEFTNTISWAYDPKQNKVIKTSDGSQISNFQCGLTSVSSYKYSYLNTKRTFHALDYSDTEHAAHQAMPSATYTSLTLGASGSTYTAPADGWFVLIKEATALYQYIDMSGAGGIETGTTAAISGSQYLYTLLPVSKGSSISIYYTAAGSTIKFRFIYANGAA